jgi:hypothetical protein
MAQGVSDTMLRYHACTALQTWKNKHQKNSSFMQSKQVSRMHQKTAVQLLCMKFMQSQQVPRMRAPYDARA